MPRQPDPGTVRFEVRAPADLHAALVQHAERDERSMNAEIIVLLREAIAARQKRRR